MLGSSHRLPRTAALFGVALLGLSMLSCRPELVVRLQTRVFFDGALERTVEVEGRDDHGARFHRDGILVWILLTQGSQDAHFCPLLVLWYQHTHECLSVQRDG